MKNPQLACLALSAGRVAVSHEFPVDPPMNPYRTVERVAGFPERMQQDFLDPLTKLLLRPIFFERLRQVEFVRKGVGGPAAAIYVDIDGLNRVNTVFGYASGDELLAAISMRLMRIVGAHGVCGRLSGDEFGILLLDLPYNNVAAQESAGIFCESILSRMSQPYRMTVASMSSVSRWVCM